jgi:hypothetical protein
MKRTRRIIVSLILIWTAGALIGIALASDIYFGHDGIPDFHPLRSNDGVPLIRQDPWMSVTTGTLHLAPVIAWLNPNDPRATLYLIFEETNDVVPGINGMVRIHKRYYFQFELMSLPFTAMPTTASCTLFKPGDRTISLNNAILVKHKDLVPGPTFTPTPTPTETPTPTPVIQIGKFVRTTQAGVACFDSPDATYAEDYMALHDIGYVKLLLGNRATARSLCYLLGASVFSGTCA